MYWSVFSECCAFCLIFLAGSSRCLIGSIFVYSCKCRVFVSLVHPLAIRRAVFRMICSLYVFVSDIMGGHMVLP